MANNVKGRVRRASADIIRTNEPEARRLAAKKGAVAEIDRIISSTSKSEATAWL
jgi:hypothetical protein